MTTTEQHANKGPAFDPFDLEIIREYLQAAIDEMFAVTVRSSQSTMIYEVLDFAVGLTDAAGRQISQGAGLAILPGVFGEIVRGALEHHPIDTLNEGDILISNDPYVPGGTHLNDFCLLMPVFFDGTVVGFAGNKAHWIDVGGKNPEVTRWTPLRRSRKGSGFRGPGSFVAGTSTTACAQFWLRTPERLTPSSAIYTPR